MPAVLRKERPGDGPQVRNVNEAAFGRRDEADLVEGLGDDGTVLLSLVAEDAGGIVGHILFSRMTVETAQGSADGGSVDAVSLAPMAVLPEYQGRGIGSELVRRGLDELHGMGEQIVIVLGHEHYYRRFGFSPELARSLSSPFPPEAYMALELREGALAGVKGAVRYSRAFGL